MAAASHASRRPGSRVDDRYKVLEHLGGGSNGQVYRAFDEHLGSEVAVKLLEPKPRMPATWDEAQMLEQLQSEYLLKVLNADIEPNSDIRYITTPVMHGGDAANAAKPVGVDTRQASMWGQQIAHGLARIHAANLVHRDIKPANVYLDEWGNALLGDLGMAATLDATGRAAPDGTPATAAPEVIAGDRHCSVRSDVYSLASTVFFFLSGEYPVDMRKFKGHQFFDAVVRGDRRKVRDVAPHVSQSLGQIVERSLSLDPDRRAQSALEFANQLASARHHKRTWRRTPHAEHELCFESVGDKRVKSLAVCVVRSKSGRLDVQVANSDGRRYRRFESEQVSGASLGATLRQLLARL